MDKITLDGNRRGDPVVWAKARMTSVAPRYPASALALLACPFCREMFEDREHEACPACGVDLVAFDKLPHLSHEALSEDGISHQPEWDLLPLTYLGRNRALLAALALVGLAAFFAPWVHVTMPDLETFTGFDLARRLGWAWGAGVGWLVLVPTVLSRRTIMHMRGARVAAAFLAAVPGVTGAVLLVRAPQGSQVPLHFTFSWGIYATIVLSLATVGAACFFGGRLDDIHVRKGTSAGQVVH